MQASAMEKSVLCETCGTDLLIERGAEETTQIEIAKPAPNQQTLEMLKKLIAITE
jgi:hypothetical protein